MINLAAFTNLAGTVLIFTSITSALIALLPPLPDDTRAYYKHTAWELLAIGFIAETINNLCQPWHPLSRLWVTAYLIITAYALTKSTNHYNTWQTLRTTHHHKQTNIQK